MPFHEILSVHPTNGLIEELSVDVVVRALVSPVEVLREEKREEEGGEGQRVEKGRRETAGREREERRVNGPDKPIR